MQPFILEGETNECETFLKMGDVAKKKSQCSVRIHVVDKIVNVLNKFNHIANAEKVEVENICENILTQMKETTHTPHVILSSALKECSQASGGKFTIIVNLKRTMRHSRQTNNANLIRHHFCQ